MAFVKDLFSGPKVPPMPAPIEQPAPPTTDDARTAAEADIQANQRKGAMANIFAPTDTGANLNKSAPEAASSLKRLLGS